MNGQFEKKTWPHWRARKNYCCQAFFKGAKSISVQIALKILFAAKKQAVPLIKVGKSLISPLILKTEIFPEWNILSISAQTSCSKMFMTQRMHVSILMMQTHLRHENNNLDRLCCASQFQDALRLSLNGTFKRCRRISWLNTAIPASFCCASWLQDAQTSQSERGLT